MEILTSDEKCKLELHDFKAMGVAWKFFQELQEKLQVPFNVLYTPKELENGARFGACSINIQGSDKIFTDVLHFCFQRPSAKRRPIAWESNSGERKKMMQKSLRRIADSLRCDMLSTNPARNKLYANLCNICETPE